MGFDAAVAHVLAASMRDGPRDDVMVEELRGWAFGSGDERTMEVGPVYAGTSGSTEALALRELAFTQLCTRVGAPPAYVQRLPVALQVANMNWGLGRTGAPALLRLAGREVRAVLSDRYAALDDAWVLELVGEALGRAGLRDGAMVRSVSTGLHTVLRITLPGEGRAVKAGDVIEHGVDVANSELGLRSVQVHPVTYRLVCTNGMRAWKTEATLRARHIGDPARLREQLREVIPLALAEARADLHRWSAGTRVRVDDVGAEVEALRSVGLGKREVQAVGHELARERGTLPADGERAAATRLTGPSTAYEMANAITATARSLPTAARLAMEEAGHRYLTRRTA
jgi:hypothetical protein